MPDPYARLAGVYDEIVVDPCHVAWADQVLRWWAEDRVVSVLDLCCGSGLMTRELVDRGLDVTGVDASLAMLALARERLGPAITLVQATLPDLPVAGPFDAVVSTLDGLNYLPPADFSASLAAIAAVLRPDGWLVFDLHGDAALDLLADNPLLQGSDERRSWTLTSVVDARRCSSVIEVIAEDPADSFVEEHVQFVHAAEDVEAALVDAGFDRIAMVDEYTESPVTDGTLRVTWLARACG